MTARDKMSSPLDSKVIQSVCCQRGIPIKVTVLPAVESTNTWVMQETRSSETILCAAEHQTGGRGRRGKTWHSPNSGITFSLGLISLRPVTWFNGLSLVVGSILCDCLRAVGAADAMVKWPNDVLVDGAKLAGILIESSVSTERVSASLETNSATTKIVIGIGINYQRGAEAQLIDQASTDLFQLCGTSLPDRSQLIAEIASQVVRQSLGDVPSAMSELVTKWPGYDALAGRELVISQALSQAQLPVHGIGAGIDPTGALKLDTADGVRLFNSADISIRQR